MVKRLYTFLCVCILLCLSGCLGIFSGESRDASNSKSSRLNGPKGDADGFQGVIATLTNSVPRCGITGAGLNQTVSCVVVVQDVNGSEWEATAIEGGIDLKWRTPNFVEGVPVQSIECHSSSNALSQSCNVVLSQSSITPTYEFGFEVSQGSISPIAKTVNVTLLAADTFGIVPHIPTFNSVLSSESTISRKVGFEVEAFNPLVDNSAFAYSACTFGKKTYIASSVSVFVMEAGSPLARLYAGNTNLANGNNFTSRLDVNLASTADVILPIACTKRGPVVANNSKQRVLILNETGPVEVINAKVRTLAASSNGEELYILSTSSITRVDLNTMTKEEIPFFPGLQNTLSINYMTVDYPFAYVSTPNQIFRINLELKENTLFAGTGETGFGGDGGPALEAKFGKNSSGIKGIAVDSVSRILWISDSGNQSIRRVSLSTGIIDTWAGPTNNLQGCGKTSFPFNVKTGGLCSPGWLHLDNEKNLVLLNDGLIEKVTQAGSSEPIFGIAPKPPVKDAEEDLSRVRMGISFGVAFLKDSLVASDYFGQTMRHLYPERNRVLNKFSTSGFQFPREVRALKDGSYIVLSSQSIHKVTADGKITLLLGHNPNAVLQDVMSIEQFKFRTRGRFSAMGGLVIHENGTIYFADGEAIFALVPGDPPKVVRVAGSPEMPGDSGNDGPALNALLHGPAGMDLGPDNSLYFAEDDNHSFRKIDLNTGIISKLVIKFKPGFAFSPMGIRARKNGSLYITHSKNGLYALVPKTSETEGQYYETSTILGTRDYKGRCSGQIRAASKEATLSSLNSLCQGRYLALDLRDTCESSTGKLELVFSQSFDTNIENIKPEAGNLVRVSIPCHLAK